MVDFPASYVSLLEGTLLHFLFTSNKCPTQPDIRHFHLFSLVKGHGHSILWICFAGAPGEIWPTDVWIAGPHEIRCAYTVDVYGMSIASGKLCSNVQDT